MFLVMSCDASEFQSRFTGLDASGTLFKEPGGGCLCLCLCDWQVPWPVRSAGGTPSTSSSGTVPPRGTWRTKTSCLAAPTPRGCRCASRSAPNWSGTWTDSLSLSHSDGCGQTSSIIQRKIWNIEGNTKPSCWKTAWYLAYSCGGQTAQAND